MGVSGSSSATGGGLSPAGVWEDSSTPRGVGVAATKDDGNAVFAQNNGADAPTLFAQNVSTTAGALVFQAAGAHFSSCAVDVNANLNCNGAITSNGAKLFKIDDPADPAPAATISLPDANV